MIRKLARRTAVATAAVALMLGSAGATEHISAGPEVPKVRENLDGTIQSGDRVYASWRDYAASSEIREFGRRCGTRLTRPAPSKAPASDPGDCTYNLTNPAAIYDPSVARYRIPVVVHVIQNTAGSGALSAATIQSQIDILNQDFLAILGSHGQGGVNIEIEFYLATLDPDGSPTSGITFSTNNTWFNDGGNYWETLAWDTARYMNVYTNSAGGDFGYVPDLPQGNLAGQTMDRIVILWSTFGANAPIGPPFDLGRTLTHEVGHWLGLEHTFTGGCASASACYTNGDLICDTNPEQTESEGCSESNSCGSPDPIHNYMNYSDDICMTGFTPEQARRMRCSLENYRVDVYTVGPGNCGNGEVEAGEECDDGNVANGDGCDENCQFEHSCGDGIVEAGEECDDGNTSDGDGCDANCLIEPTCGNGVIESGEECDDGNTLAGDGCDAVCRLEGTCGNGIVEADEECDDGNVANGDGCDADCLREGVGDCCSSGHGTGCSEPAIEACVCGLDAYCCNIEWDDLCVEQVETFGCASCVVVPPPAEVSAVSADPLLFGTPSALQWEDASANGVLAYNVYRGTVSALGPGNYGSCFRSGLTSASTTDTELPDSGVAWFYLVTGVNAAGEGTMGRRSSGVPRPNATPCP